MQETAEADELFLIPSFILLRRGERVIIRDCTCYTFISQIISGGIMLHCVTVLHVELKRGFRRIQYLTKITRLVVTQGLE